MREQLLERLRFLIKDPMPLPGGGDTPSRHRRLMAVGRADLSLARLAEAHWDAVAILCEAGREPAPNIVYGVWASEKPGLSLSLEQQGEGSVVWGKKMFCSGSGLVDRALVTLNTPEQQLVDIDMKANINEIQFEESDWKTAAFGETKTATVVFNGARVCRQDLIGDSEWYLQRQASGTEHADLPHAGLAALPGCSIMLHINREMIHTPWLTSAQYMHLSGRWNHTWIPLAARSMRPPGIVNVR